MHAPQWLVSQPTCVPVSPKTPANEVDQQHPRLDQGFAIAAIHFDVNYLLLRHIAISMRIAICWRAQPRATRARCANSFTKPLLYSAGPRRSEVGCASSPANCALAAKFASSSFFPRRNASALAALSDVGPTFVSAMPDCTANSVGFDCHCAATAAVAKSPTFLSSLKYAPPLARRKDRECESP